jgi:hypothetical protein
MVVYDYVSNPAKRVSTALKMRESSIEGSVETTNGLSHKLPHTLIRNDNSTQWKSLTYQNRRWVPRTEAVLLKQEHDLYCEIPLHDARFILRFPTLLLGYEQELFRRIILDYKAS